MRIDAQNDWVHDQVETLSWSVADFHRRFGIERPADEDLLPFFSDRLNLLIEELGEHAAAANRGDVDKAINEFVDVVYVALLGRCTCWGGGRRMQLTR